MHIRYPDKIYSEEYMQPYMLDNTDILCIRANMGIGKTKNLKSLFKKYNKIIIVSFRISLNKEHAKKFGFTLYSDIEGPVYDTEINNKIVVQIDSFHKITGKCDLLVLDEYTYTMTHLIEYAKKREQSYQALEEYIKGSKKVIAIDAFIKGRDVEWLERFNRKTTFIENIYKKHENKIVINYDNNIGIFMNSIVEYLNNKNKIVVPTNNKRFIIQLEKYIKSKCNNIKGLFITADNSNDLNTDIWNNYDIVAFSPTIVAGVSYEELHFDACFGYFTNSSACAEMAVQQMFRVRNIKLNEIHVCVEIDGKNDFPTNREDIDEYIVNRSSCLVEGMENIKISRINKEVYRDSYYKLFLIVQRNLFRSRNDYFDRLKFLLSTQGIKITNKIYTEEEKLTNIQINKEIRKYGRNCNKEYKDNINNKMIELDDIDFETAQFLDEKTYKTLEEKLKLKKYDFKNKYNYYDELTLEIYNKYEKKYTQYKNLSLFYQYKNNIFEELSRRIEEIEDTKIQKINEAKEIGITPNIYILHNNKKYEKFTYCLQILKVLGFNSPIDESVCKIDKNKLYSFIKQKGKMIELLFKTKKYDWDNIILEENGFKTILRYLNERLKSIFLITIKLKNKKEEEYNISGLDFWDEKINPKNDAEGMSIDKLLSILNAEN